MKPAPQIQGGTLLFQVVIPGVGLGSATERADPALDIRALPEPDRDSVTYVSILLLEPGRSPTMLRFGDVNATVLDSWSLHSGATVIVGSHMAPLRPDNEALLRSVAPHFQAVDLNRIDPEPSEPGSIRSFMILNSPDGVGRLLDVDVNQFLLWSRAPTLQDGKHGAPELQ